MSDTMNIPADNNDSAAPPAGPGQHTPARPHAVAPLRTATGFIPPLEGMRALAAVGVLTTHVAFLTATSTGSTVARVWGRFDLWVAVFFALSGFLLWRRHALSAHDGGLRRDSPAGPARPVREYYRSRGVRILPAYLVVVVVAMIALPENVGAGFVEWFANLALIQVFVPGGLVAGLTHAWSLSVEAAFYVVLPLLWLSLAPLREARAKWRVPVIAAVSAVSLGWAFIPFTELGLPGGVNPHTLPAAFASWFAVGILLAEFTAAPPRALLALYRAPWAKWLWWAAAALIFLSTTSTRLYAEGFVQASPPEFVGRTASGALIAWCLLSPIVLAGQSARFPMLGSRPMLALGRWSYGIFLWHVVVLQLLFGVLGVPMFGGHMALMWVATLAATIVVAAASYAWVEEPARRAAGQSPLRPLVPAPPAKPSRPPRPSRSGAE